jgi:hypothetical protein
VIVRLLVGLAGRDFSVSAGEFYTCDPESGARMIAAGVAEPVERDAPVEQATAAAPERAARRLKR